MAGAAGSWSAWPAAAAAAATCSCSTSPPRPPSRASAAAAGPSAARRFAAHWRNWRRLRAGLFAPAALPGPGVPADPSGLQAEGWASVRLLDRPSANRLGQVDIPALTAIPATKLS